MPVSLVGILYRPLFAYHALPIDRDSLAYDPVLAPLESEIVICHDGGGKGDRRRYASCLDITVCILKVCPKIPNVDGISGIIDRRPAQVVHSPDKNRAVRIDRYEGGKSREFCGAIAESYVIVTETSQRLCWRKRQCYGEPASAGDP